LAEEHAVRITL